MLSSSASCRRRCRSRLPPCPRGPASPLDSWASPKPESCNCAGVSHSSNTVCACVRVGSIQAPFDAISFLVKHLVAASLGRVGFLACFLLFFPSHFLFLLHLHSFLLPVTPPPGRCAGLLMPDACICQAPHRWTGEARCRATAWK